MPSMTLMKPNHTRDVRWSRPDAIPATLLTQLPTCLCKRLTSSLPELMPLPCKPSLSINKENTSQRVCFPRRCSVKVEPHPPIAKISIPRDDRNRQGSIESGRHLSNKLKRNETSATRLRYRLWWEDIKPPAHNVLKWYVIFAHTIRTARINRSFTKALRVMDFFYWFGIILLLRYKQT